jgi:hypothetical protein
MITGDDDSADVSCTSYSWIYLAQDASGFEARRALTHLARSREGGTGQDSSDDVNDVLRYIRAANELHGAAETALRDVVAEARRRGVPWAKIAEELDRGVSATQGRFGDHKAKAFDREAAALGLNALRVASEAVETATSARIPEDERTPDGAPDIEPEVYFTNAIRRLIRASFAYENTIHHPLRAQSSLVMPEEWWRVLEDLIEELRTGAWDLARSGSIHALLGRDRYWPVPPYIDLSPGVYFSYACFHAAASVEHLTRLADDLARHDEDGFRANVESAHKHQKALVENLTRPECLIVIQLINGREAAPGQRPD